MKILLTHISKGTLQNERIIGIQIGSKPESNYVVEIPEDKKEGKVSIILDESLLFDLINIGWKNHANEAFYLQELNLVFSEHIGGNKIFEFPIDLSESGLGFKKTKWIDRIFKKTRRLLKRHT